MEQQIHTVDIILVRDAGEIQGPAVLLIQRLKAPYEGCWAFPGGKVECEDETLEMAALRELREETGLVLPDAESTNGRVLVQLQTYGDKLRDPRPGRWISTAFWARVSQSEWFNLAPTFKAGSDASRLGWFSLNSLPDLAFDHESMLADMSNFGLL